MARRERDILEHAVRAISEQAANANKVIDEALAVGLPSDHPVTLQAKMLRLELLKVKADLERELGTWVLDCKACGMEVHWVQGVSMADPGALGASSPRAAWGAGGLDPDRLRGGPDAAGGARRDAAGRAASYLGH